MSTDSSLHAGVTGSPERGLPEADAGELLALLRRMQKAQRGRPSALGTRLDALARLEAALLRRKDAICDAIRDDFGSRSRHESLMAEVFLTLQGIRHARAHLAEWMRPRARDVGWMFRPARAETLPQPLGVVGIIAPWNYPVQLALAPLVGALAAGNRAMLKPSEYVPATAALLRDLAAEAFASDEVAVVTGGPEVGAAFARLPFDHLVFTGSTRVGRAVMRAASENLTPVTLELGGKSPALVAPGFAPDTAAARIMNGKLFNAGQTCIAPDYALVPAEARERFVAECRAAVRAQYPTLQANPDYTSIVNDRHYARLAGYLDDARDRGATVVSLDPAGEALDPRFRRMAPALVLDPTEDMAVMQEEIFGPILPVKTYDTLDEAIGYVNDHPRPLALYLFSHDADATDKVLAETLSGGVTVNDTMLHVAQDDLPFGGVGASGMGHYHGVQGFDAMTKYKPVFYQSRVNGRALLNPPYGRAIDAFLGLLLRPLR